MLTRTKTRDVGVVSYGDVLRPTYLMRLCGTVGRRTSPYDTILTSLFYSDQILIS